MFEITFHKNDQKTVNKKTSLSDADDDWPSCYSANYWRGVLPRIIIMNDLTIWLGWAPLRDFRCPLTSFLNWLKSAKLGCCTWVGGTWDDKETKLNRHCEMTTETSNKKNTKKNTKITHSGKAKHLRVRMIWNSTNIWGKLKLVQLPLPVEVSYKSLNNASDLCISP